MNEYLMAKNGEKYYEDYGDTCYDESISPAANTSKQIGGSHYQLPTEPWDFIVQNKLGYLEGNISKYIYRYKNKNGIEDLKKAIHYLEKLIQEESK